MNPPSDPPAVVRCAPSHRRRKGFALVVTMSALILMSVLLLAFFSRALLNRQIAFSSTNLAKADLMARASLDFVIGEIRQEIESDSAITTSNGFTLLQPLTSASRIPQRSGIAGADANGAFTLAKVTAPGVSLGGGVVTASDDSISQAGGGSRHFVSAQRWFGSGGPSLGSQTNVPTWIYLTRGQGISTAPLVEDAKNRASGSYVNGRFACTVYDVSGLLNANVAGFPTAMTNQAATKTSAAYADLTAISTNFTAADVQQFVAWRNPLASASASRFAKWATGVSTNTSDATDALLLRVARGGHLQVASGENAFLSRRDLLRTTNSSVAFSSAALSGVTHFSRTVNAPIWTPPFNSTNTPNYFGGSGTVAVAYAGNADAPAATNRNVPNVRFSFSGTVNRHADDGSVTPVAVRAGQPLVGRRFSLAKLAWLTYKGPSATLPASDPQYNAAGTAAAIQACFGLRWIPGGTADEAPCWEYVGPTGTTPQDTIKTLGAVAAESTPREPNFFELLKAGILAGSLGKDPGPESPGATFTGGWPEPSFEGAATFDHDTYGKEKDRQLIQIAANIMDQADTDGFPTTIHFVPPGFVDSTVARKAYNTVYGIENLPYIERLGPIDAEYPRETMNMWIRPELWNPHQATVSTNGPRPAEFRTRCYGQVQWRWFLGVGNGGPNPIYPQEISVPVVFDSAATPDSRGTVYFRDTPGMVGSAFYNNPKMLTKSLLSPTFATPNENIYAHNDAAAAASMVYPLDNLANPPDATKQFAGIWLGSLPGPSTLPYVAPDFNKWMDTNLGWQEGQNDFHFRFRVMPTRFSVALECWDGSHWRPYSLVSRIDLVRSSEHWRPYPVQHRPNYNGETLSTQHSWILSDPRTERFSVLARRINAGFAQHDRKNQLEQTMEPDATFVFGTESFFPWRTSGFTYVTSTAPFPNPVPAGSGGWPGWSGISTSAFAVNDPNTMPFPSGNAQGFNSYYPDPDGVVRPGDSLYRERATGEGSMLYHASVLTGSASRRRPVILDRPFQSVGELGYAFRDLPFKTLDFFTPSSADAALMDLFCVSDEPEISVGRINPSAAPAGVLQAVLKGAGKQVNDPANAIDLDLARTVANNVTAQIALASSNPRPLRDKGSLTIDLMNRTNGIPASLTGADKGNKTLLEAPVRALSSFSDMRTWNLLIDVVAQTGRVAGNAANMSDFVVEGERRYWYHVAIDRYTGEVIDSQLEPVYE